MTGIKQSDFTAVTSVDLADNIPLFTAHENKRITYANMLEQLTDEIAVRFIYPTIAQLQQCGLEADEDDPNYVRCEETLYRLYKITSLAVGVDDIALDNGRTASYQEEYSKSGFVLGAASSTNNALALFDGATGTQLKTGAVLSTIGGNLASATSIAQVSYPRVDASNAVTMATPTTVKTDLNLPANTAASITTIEGDISTIEGDISTIEGDISTIESDILFLEDNIQVQIDTWADIATVTPTAAGQLFTLAQHTSGSIGGGTLMSFVGSVSDDGGTQKNALGGFYLKRQQPIRTAMNYGALGNNVQTLFATSYQTDITPSPVTITQQTSDALALNKAIVSLRAAGGGMLYIPKGIYRIYGYLERIDFPCKIIGDGIDQTILKNCDASPAGIDGYGIFCVQPSSLSYVSFENLTVDGNGTARTGIAEVRCYPIALYGALQGHMSNVKSINSTIDCLVTDYANESKGTGTYQNYFNYNNCIFDNSYRNTVSLIYGDNQFFVNCRFLRGGKVQGGTNPRYCLDIEPDQAIYAIKNLHFSNCEFSGAENALTGGTWCEAVFDNCTWNINGGIASGYPWAFVFGQAQVTISNSKVNGNPAEMNGISKSYNTHVTGSYKETQYLKVADTVFTGCGFHSIGRRTTLENVDFFNSKMPVLIESDTVFRHEVFIRNVSLTNVIDFANFGTGTLSSFAIKNTTEGPVIIDGLNVMIDTASLPTSPTFITTSQFGIFIDPAGLSVAEIKASNVHVSGYYRKLPNATGQALNTANFRDWNAPSVAPANTATQITGAATYYNNCTMYGDFV